MYLICLWKCFVKMCVVVSIFLMLFVFARWSRVGRCWFNSRQAVDCSWYCDHRHPTTASRAQLFYQMVVLLRRGLSSSKADSRPSQYVYRFCCYYIIVINHLSGGLIKVLVGREQLLRFDYTFFRVAIQLGKQNKPVISTTGDNLGVLI